MSAFKHDVFISYPSERQSVADAWAKVFDRPFLFTDAPSYANELGDGVLERKLEEAVASSRDILLVYGPSHRSSPWCGFEAEKFRLHETGGLKRNIYVVVDEPATICLPVPYYLVKGPPNRKSIEQAELVVPPRLDPVPLPLLLGPVTWTMTLGVDIASFAYLGRWRAARRGLADRPPIAWWLGRPAVIALCLAVVAIILLILSTGRLDDSARLATLLGATSTVGALYLATTYSFAAGIAAFLVSMGAGAVSVALHRTYIDAAALVAGVLAGSAITYRNRLDAHGGDRIDGRVAHLFALAGCALGAAVPAVALRLVTAFQREVVVQPMLFAEAPKVFTLFGAAIGVSSGITSAVTAASQAIDATRRRLRKGRIVLTATASILVCTALGALAGWAARPPTIARAGWDASSPTYAVGVASLVALIVATAFVMPIAFGRARLGARWSMAYALLGLLCTYFALRDPLAELPCFAGRSVISVDRNGGLGLLLSTVAGFALTSSTSRASWIAVRMRLARVARREAIAWGGSMAMHLLLFLVAMRPKVDFRLGADAGPTDPPSRAPIPQAIDVWGAEPPAGGGGSGEVPPTPPTFETIDGKLERLDRLRNENPSEYLAAYNSLTTKERSYYWAVTYPRLHKVDYDREWKRKTAARTSARTAQNEAERSGDAARASAVRAAQSLAEVERHVDDATALSGTSEETAHLRDLAVQAVDAARAAAHAAEEAETARAATTISGDAKHAGHDMASRAERGAADARAGAERAADAASRAAVAEGTAKGIAADGEKWMARARWSKQIGQPSGPGVWVETGPNGHFVVHIAPGYRVTFSGDFGGGKLVVSVRIGNVATLVKNGRTAVDVENKTASDLAIDVVGPAGACDDKHPRKPNATTMGFEDQTDHDCNEPVLTVIPSSIWFSPGA